MTKLLVCFMFFITSFFSLFKIKNKKDYQFIFLLICCALLLVITFRNGEELNDYDEYVKMYDNYQEKFVRLYSEPTFFLLATLLNKMSLSVLSIFAVYGFLGLWTKVSLIKKISPYYYLSLAAYLSYEFINQEMIAIRAGVAIGFLLYSIYFIHQKRRGMYFLCIICATLFHYSAIVFLPFILFSKMCKSNIWRMFFLACSLLLFFMDFSKLAKLIPIHFIRSKVVYYLKKPNTSVVKTLLRPTILYRYMILFFFMYYEKYLHKKNEYISLEIDYLLYGLFLNNVFGSNEVMSYRMSMLGFSVEYLLLPNMVYVIKEKNLAKLLVIFLSAFNLLFSIYVSHIFH